MAPASTVNAIPHVARVSQVVTALANPRSSDGKHGMIATHRILSAPNRFEMRRIPTRAMDALAAIALAGGDRQGVACVI